MKTLNAVSDVEAYAEEVFTSTLATVSYLKKEKLNRIFVIGEGGLIDRRLVLDEAGRVMRARDFTVGTKYPMVVVKTGVTLNKAKLVYLDKSAILETDVTVLKGLGIVAI